MHGGLLHRLDDHLRGVPQNRRPPRAYEVYVFVAVGVPNRGTAGPLREKRSPTHRAKRPHGGVHSAGDPLQCLIKKGLGFCAHPHAATKYRLPA